MANGEKLMSTTLRSSLQSRNIYMQQVLWILKGETVTANGVSKVNLFPHVDGTTLKECCLALF